MKRWLAALLASASLVVVAPTAQAATTLTLQASATSVTYGDPVRFSGRAAGVAPGTVVKLQRKVPTGWRTVAKKQVWAARTYTFRTTPAKGEQRYRVLKPRQLGKPRAVSRTVTLSVHWHPTLTLGQVQHDVDTDDGSVSTTVHGQAPDLPSGSVLVRERRLPDDSWTKIGEAIVDGAHSWSDTFASVHDWEVRYAAGASGARLASASAPFTVDGSWTPTIVLDATTMDELTDKVTVTGTTTGLPAGSLIQRQIKTGDDWVDFDWPTDVREDGSFQHTFSALLNEDFRYRAAPSAARREATSATFSFTDSPVVRVSLNSQTLLTLPAGGTTRSVVVHLDAGQRFTFMSRDDWARVMTDPAGVEHDLGDGAVTMLAGDAGDYTFDITAPTAGGDPREVYVYLSVPVVVPTALNGAGVDVNTTVPGQLAEVVFAAEAGTLVSEYALPPQYSSEHGVVSLLDPSGAVVPVWKELPGGRSTWRLPALDGDYRLRITPYGLIQRDDQVVLSAVEATAQVDGDPAHVALNRPGQVAVVSVTVPAGLDLSWSKVSEYSTFEDFYDPSGDQIYNNWTLQSTEAGTYSLVLDYEDSPVEVDYYFSTPVEYALELGSKVEFDQGPAPHREATLSIPVTEGQLFSLEVLDDEAEPCFPSVPYEAGDELAWSTFGYGHPALFKIAETGELVVQVRPCSATGSFRPQLVEVVPAPSSESTVDPWGHTVVTTELAMEATEPGQVMVAEYDNGDHYPSGTTVTQTASTFPGGTEVALAYVLPSSSMSSGFNGGFSTSSWDKGVLWIIGYAGPTATGTLDLELERLEH